MGSITDDSNKTLIGTSATGFPFEDQTSILIEKGTFEGAFGDPTVGPNTLLNQNISQVFLRVKAGDGVSLWYRVKQVSLATSGGYYKLEVGKKFGPDMGITSTDGTYLNRLVCEVQVVKRTPEDRAEFEGRFFVKILKDPTIEEKV